MTFQPARCDECDSFIHDDIGGNDRLCASCRSADHEPGSGLRRADYEPEWEPERELERQ